MKLFKKPKTQETELLEFSSTSVSTSESTPVLPRSFNPDDFTTWQQGPREKNLATQQLEVLLQKLAATQVGNASMKRVSGGDWYLCLRDTNNQVEETNVSVLLRHATFLHVRLTRNEQLGLISHYPAWPKHQPKDAAIKDTVYTKMKPYQRAALYIYTQKYYKEIHAFFRGNYANPYYDLGPLACLVVWAVMDQAKKKIPRLVSKFPEFQKDLITGDLHRHEIFQAAEIEHHRRGVVSTGHILSLSISPLGREQLQITGDIPWTVSMAPVSAYEPEKEVQVDGQLHCVAGPNGKTVARFVNSPDHDKPSRLVSATAMSFVYQHHLSKTYKDVPEATTIDGVVIERPYHNITMTGSTLCYLLPVVDLLIKHANSVEVTSTLRNLTNDDLEFLRLLIIFDVSGRESEVSFSTNPELARLYRIASGNNFATYAQRETQYSAEQIALGRELIIQRTVPGCELINHPYWLVISMIHVLDLVRCWDNTKYQKTLDEYRVYLSADQTADKDWQALIEFAEVCVEGFDNHRTARGKFGRGSVFKLFSTWVNGVDQIVGEAPAHIPTPGDCKRIRDIFASLATQASHVASHSAPASSSSNAGQQNSDDLYKTLKDQFKSEKEFLHNFDQSSDLYKQYTSNKLLSSFLTKEKINYDHLFNPGVIILPYEKLDLAKLSKIPEFNILNYINQNFKTKFLLQGTIHKQDEWGMKSLLNAAPIISHTESPKIKFDFFRDPDSKKIKEIVEAMKFGKIEEAKALIEKLKTSKKRRLLTAPQHQNNDDDGDFAAKRRKRSGKYT